MMRYIIICRLVNIRQKLYNAILSRVYDRLDSFIGEVAEWSIASDLKSDEAKTSGSSNLPLSVEKYPNYLSNIKQLQDCTQAENS
jgi:hypothetical protein